MQSVGDEDGEGDSSSDSKSVGAMLNVSVMLLEGGGLNTTSKISVAA